MIPSGRVDFTWSYWGLCPTVDPLKQWWVSEAERDHWETGCHGVCPFTKNSLADVSKQSIMVEFLEFEKWACSLVWTQNARAVSVMYSGTYLACKHLKAAAPGPYNSSRDWAYFHPWGPGCRNGSRLGPGSSILHPGPGKCRQRRTFAMPAFDPAESPEEIYVSFYDSHCILLSVCIHWLWVFTTTLMFFGFN